MHTAVGELSIVDPVTRTFLKNALLIFQVLLLFLRTDCIRPVCLASLFLVTVLLQLLLIAQLQRISRNEPNTSLCSHVFNWILYIALIASFITWATISLTLAGGQSCFDIDNFILELFFTLWSRLFVWDADYFMFNFSKSIIFGWALIAWMVSTIVLALPEEAPPLPVRFAVSSRLL